MNKTYVPTEKARLFHANPPNLEAKLSVHANFMLIGVCLGFPNGFTIEYILEGMKKAKVVMQNGPREAQAILKDGTIISTSIVIDYLCEHIAAMVDELYLSGCLAFA
jgi:hypothetical protein